MALACSTYCLYTGFRLRFRLTLGTKWQPVALPLKHQQGCDTPRDCKQYGYYTCRFHKTRLLLITTPTTGHIHFYTHTDFLAWSIKNCSLRVCFNSLNRVTVLWNARILWPQCSRFLLSTYRGHATLVVHGSPKFIYSRKSVTQGDPVFMFFIRWLRYLLVDLSQRPIPGLRYGMPMVQPVLLNWLTYLYGLIGWDSWAQILAITLNHVSCTW